jgi:hypothetical protein
MAKEKSATTKRRRLADFPEHRAAAAKLVELQLQRAEAIRRLDRAVEAQSSRGRFSEREARRLGAAVLAGEPLAAVAAPPTGPDLEVLERERDVITAACALQSEIVAKLKHEAQLAIAADLEAEVGGPAAALARTLGEGIEAALRACDAMAALADEILRDVDDLQPPAALYLGEQARGPLLQAAHEVLRSGLLPAGGPLEAAVAAAPIAAFVNAVQP